jgi:hypothetical protein
VARHGVGGGRRGAAAPGPAPPPLARGAHRRGGGGRGGGVLRHRRGRLPVRPRTAPLRRARVPAGHWSVHDRDAPRRGCAVGLGVRARHSSGCCARSSRRRFIRHSPPHSK